MKFTWHMIGETTDGVFWLPEGARELFPGRSKDDPPMHLCVIALKPVTVFMYVIDNGLEGTHPWQFRVAGQQVAHGWSGSRLGAQLAAEERARTFIEAIKVGVGEVSPSAPV